MSAIGQNDRRIQYTTAGGESSFAYDFQIDDADHIQAYRDGVLQIRGTHYSVTGVGNAGGGDIVPDASLTIVSGEVWTISGDTPEDRSNDYSGFARVPPQTIDSDLDRVIFMVQQLRRDSNRAIRIDIEEATDEEALRLPGSAARASKTLAFDANGDVVVVDSFTSGASTPGDIDASVQDNDAIRWDAGEGDFKRVPMPLHSAFARAEGDSEAIGVGALGKPASLSALQALDTSAFTADEVVYLRGRTSVGDGGEGHFRWDSSNLSTEVGNDEVTVSQGDGGIYIAPASDKTGANGAWVRQFIGFPQVVWYGADPSGASDSSAAFAAADASGDFEVSDDGSYLIASNATLSSRMRVGRNVTITVDKGTTLTVNSLVDPIESKSPFIVNGTLSLAETYNVDVPGDFATVQEAVDACPRNIIQYYKVRLADGKYEEDVRIEGIRASAVTRDPASNPQMPRFILVGASQTSQDPDVEVKSIYAQDCSGSIGHPSIQDLSVYGENPYTDEDARIEFYGCHNGAAGRINFNSASAVSGSTGVVAYASLVEVNAIDFGSGVITTAFEVKHSGILSDKGGHSGSITSRVITLSRGIAYTSDISEIGTSGGAVKVLDANTSPLDINSVGLVVDAASGQLFGAGSFAAANRTTIHSMFESIDSYGTTTSGSGSVALNAADGVDLNTGTTGGSSAELDFTRPDMLSLSSFDNFIKLSVSFKVEINQNSHTFYAVVGDLSGSYFGLKLVAADLFVVSNDGTGEATDKITEPVGSGASVSVEARLYPGVGVEGWNGGTAKNAEVLTKIPSGSISDKKIDFKTDNGGVANACAVIIREYAVYSH